MRTASTISLGLHAAVIAWGLFSFTGKSLEATPVESMPVDIISADQFSQLTKGVKEAPKAETPKPLVEKKAEPKPAEEQKPKISEKKEIAASAAPPPVPETKPTDAKPDQQKPDPIAEALKKEEKKPLPPKRPARNEPKFDANKIAALLDKRAPQRNAATGEQLNTVPSLGAASGNAAKLSQSELDALRARLMALWNPPVGLKNPEEFIIRIRIQLKPDGRLSGPPMVLTSGKGVQFESVRDGAIRAVLRGQPFDMLKKETYETWQDIEVTFDPRDMFRG
jgi:colicin import membrane protein